MTPRSRRAWLIAGALTGCAFAAVQILHDVRLPVRLLAGVAARVNGRTIDAASVDRTVAGFDTRLRESVPGARARVLSRMIDEELLVQHALEDGAAETDPEVRAALVRASITRANAEVAAQALSDAEIDAFFAAHRASYANAARYAVTPLYYEAPAYPSLLDAQRRAAAARQGLAAGRGIDSLQHEADALPFAPPSDLATARTLANYFGPPLVAGLEGLAPGEATPPSPFGRGVVLLVLTRRLDSEAPTLQSSRELVQADALREKQDRALEELLQSLRSKSHIDIAPDSHP